MKNLQLLVPEEAVKELESSLKTKLYSFKVLTARSPSKKILLLEFEEHVTELKDLLTLIRKLFKKLGISLASLWVRTTGHSGEIIHIEVYSVKNGRYMLDSSRAVPSHHVAPEGK